MKQTIGQYEFQQAFVNAGRGNQFSISALDEMFNYLEDMDPEMELDVIALCCGFQELTEREAREQYDIPEDEEWQEWLGDRTLAIPVDEDTVVIEQF